MDKAAAIQKLAAKERERFLTSREKFIGQVRTYMASINKLPERVVAGVEPNFHGKTVEEIFPKLMSDSPKNEDIQKEKEEFSKFYTQVSAIREKYIDESYQRMTGQSSTV